MVQMDTPLLAGLLAEALIERAPNLDRVYMCNSGTEAVEAALKFARCATGRPRVLYCDHAFHGLTAGSLSVNGAKEFRDGFGPLLPGTAGPLRRPRRPAPGAGAGRRGRPDHRTGPGQGRAGGARRVPGRGVGPPPPPRGPADLRRGADGVGADRPVVQLRVRRGAARPGDRGQDPVRRVRPGRRHSRHVAGLPAGVLVDGPHAGPRLHLRHQRPGHGRRPGHPVGDRRRGADRQRRHGGRRAHAGPPGRGRALRAGQPTSGAAGC